MTVSLLDRSNYYRGLLVLAAKDRIIDRRERELMLQWGRILDFEWRFCEAAIDDLLENKYLSHEPVIFSDRKIAECFLRDAIRLALADENLHPQELNWLMDVAQVNGLTQEWLDTEIRRSKEAEAPPGQPVRFEIEQHL